MIPAKLSDDEDNRNRVNAEKNFSGAHREDKKAGLNLIKKSNADDCNKGLILVVDDEENVRKTITEYIKRTGYACFEAQNAKEALAILQNNKIDVVVSDIVLPDINGLELTKTVKEKYDSNVIVITGYQEDYKYEQAIKNGASDFLLKPFSLKELIIRIERVLRERSLLLDQQEAEKLLNQSIVQLRKAMGGIIQAMALTLERRDPYTAGHQRRVSNLARFIATNMGLSKDEVECIRIAGFIHDIGKISVPAEILSKPGVINENEFALIKSHTETGHEILKEVDFPWPIAQIVIQHHEKIDGSGYPDGFYGNDILLGARILCVADVVEAMASHRPYRPALGVDAALEEISNNSGRLFDRDAVDACLNVFANQGFKFT